MIYATAANYNALFSLFIYFNVDFYFPNININKMAFGNGKMVMVKKYIFNITFKHYLKKAFNLF